LKRRGAPVPANADLSSMRKSAPTNPKLDKNPKPANLARAPSARRCNAVVFLHLDVSKAAMSAVMPSSAKTLFLLGGAGDWRRE